MAIYTYSISQDITSGEVNESSLHEEIQASVITIAIDSIDTNGDDLDIEFKADLTAGEESTLDSIVQNHSGELVSSISKTLLVDGNGNEQPCDSDGSLLSRTKITRTGWHLFAAGFEFETSKLNSATEPKYDGTETGFASCKFYDDQDNELTTQNDIDSDCVKSVLDWEPTFDYEILGGRIYMKTSPNQELRMYAIMVPDLTYEQGGSRYFLCNANLEFFSPEHEVTLDGKAPKLMSYNATYHTNKIRYIFRHPAGFQHRIQLIMDAYKE